MLLRKRKWSVICIAILLSVFLASCKKKPPPPPPPPPPPVVQAPPPPPAAPTINEFTAEPSSIERGQSSTLKWSTSNATQVSIGSGVGTVQSSGSHAVYPSETTTYEMTATGPGGSVQRSVTVNVTAPPPPPPPPAPPKETLEQRLEREVRDAFFDYDKSDIREDARATLTGDADALKRIFSEFPSATITMEGHCDERGSAEYNLGLGDRRSTAAKDFLVSLGVPADRLKTISYGKERPVCTDHNEDCWQKCRHVHFVASQ
jgi:peptidoglycan-associated lipoprotein